MHDSARDSGLSLTTHRVLCGALLLLAVGVHLAHSVYDGRIILDHDQIFLDLFHNIHIAGPDAGTPWRQLVFAWETSFAYFYLLISSLLAGLHALGVTVDLTLYRLFNPAFYALLLIGAWRLGTLLADDRRVGLLSAAAVCCLPVIDNFSRSYTIHFHLTALMLMALVEMVRLLRDRHTFSAYPLLGMWCGLATLVHPIGLMQSAPIYFLLALHLLRERKSVGRGALKFAAAVAPAAILAVPVLHKLTDYSGSRAHFLSAEALASAGLAQNFYEWLRESTITFFGPGYLALFAVLGTIAVAHLIRSRPRKPAEMYLAAIVAAYGAMICLVRLNAGFTADFMIIHAAAVCLSLAVAWRALAARAKARYWLGALTVAVFLLGGLDKAARVDAYPADRYVAPRIEFIYHRKMVVEPDWVMSVEQALARAGAPQSLTIAFGRERLDPESPRPNEMASAYLLRAGLQLLGRHAEIVEPDLPAPVTVEALQLDRAYAARETADVLAARIGRQAADFADVQWFVKNGMFQAYGLNTENVLLIVRFRPPR
ncbi:MAG TPA: hypothetical protein PKW95_10090 [bacterium]|nr:hypothetical protein [bacterium]